MDIDPAGAQSPPPVEADLPARSFPGATQRWTFIPTLIVASLGVYLAMGASIGTGFAKLAAELDPTGKYVGVAIASALGGIVVTVVTPLAGRLSDRTRSRLGMRKPWLLWGSLVGLAGTIGMTLTTDMTLIIVSIGVAQAGYALVLMAQHALLAEQVPSNRLGMVNGWVGVAGMISYPLATWFVAFAPESTWVWFVGPGVLGTVFSLLLLPAFRDRVLDTALARLTVRDAFASYWLSPRKAPDFAWAWAGRFMMFLAFAPLAAFWLYYLTDWVGMDIDNAVSVLAQVSILATVVTAVASVLCGWISDRIGRRKPLVYFCTAAYVGAIVLLFAMPNITGFWLAYGVLASLASGAFSSVVVALQIELLPDFADAGKDLGIVSLSGSLPMIVGPLLTPLLLSIGQAPNYNATLVFGVVGLIVAGLCFVPIRGAR